MHLEQDELTGGVGAVGVWGGPVKGGPTIIFPELLVSLLHIKGKFEI